MATAESATSSDGASSASAAQLNAALVFQCVKCQCIVGDSVALVKSDESQQSLTLSAVSNIKWSSSVETAKDGYDVGNTYFTFGCAQCGVGQPSFWHSCNWCSLWIQALYGKYYLTTSSDLDYAREKFTFNISSIKSYVLGFPQHGTIPFDSNTFEQTETVLLTSDHKRGVSALEADMVQVWSICRWLLPIYDRNVYFHTL